MISSDRVKIKAFLLAGAAAMVFVGGIALIFLN